MHAGKERLIALDGPQQVAANFILHGNAGGAGIKVRNALQLTDGTWLGMSCGMS